MHAHRLCELYADLREDHPPNQRTLSAMTAYIITSLLLRRLLASSFYPSKIAESL